MTGNSSFSPEYYNDYIIVVILKYGGEGRGGGGGGEGGGGNLFLIVFDRDRKILSNLFTAIIM